MRTAEPWSYGRRSLINEQDQAGSDQGDALVSMMMVVILLLIDRLVKDFFKAAFHRYLSWRLLTAAYNSGVNSRPTARGSFFCLYQGWAWRQEHRFVSGHAGDAAFLG